MNALVRDSGRASNVVEVEAAVFLKLFDRRFAGQLRLKTRIQSRYPTLRRPTPRFLQSGEVEKIYRQART